MPRAIISTTQDICYDGTGTGASVTPSATNINNNFIEAFQERVVVEATANTTTFQRFAPKTAATITGISLKRHTAIATGTCTVAVQDADGNTLLSTATIDATALTASFVAQALTAVSANLNIAAGEPCKVIFVSNSGSTTGGPVVALITYAGV